MLAARWNAVLRTGACQVAIYARQDAGLAVAAGRGQGCDVISARFLKARRVLSALTMLLAARLVAVADEAKALILRLRARFPAARLDLPTVKSSAKRAALLEAQRDLNARLAALARSRRGVELLDVATPLLVLRLGQPMTLAVGLSLAAVGVTAGFGAVRHWYRRGLELRSRLVFAAGGMVLAPAGARPVRDLAGGSSFRSGAPGTLMLRCPQFVPRSGRFTLAIPEAGA